MTPSSKALPLEGGGLGGGVGSRFAGSQRDVSPSNDSPPAHTPNPSPSPLEGEGRSQRYADDHRYTARAAGQAKRLRRETTWTEKLLWAEFRKLPLQVRRQAPIGTYIADFAVVTKRLVIEVDGARHGVEQAQLHDAVRDSWLNSQGFRVLRFTHAQIIADAASVAAQVRQAAEL